MRVIGYMQNNLKNSLKPFYRLYKVVSAFSFSPLSFRSIVSDNLHCQLLSIVPGVFILAEASKPRMSCIGMTDI